MANSFNPYDYSDSLLSSSDNPASSAVPDTAQGFQGVLGWGLSDKQKKRLEKEQAKQRAIARANDNKLTVLDNFNPDDVARLKKLKAMREKTAAEYLKNHPDADLGNYADIDTRRYYPVSKKNFEAINDAVKSGALDISGSDMVAYDRRPVFRQLANLLNSYFYVPQEKLDAIADPTIPEEELAKYDYDDTHPDLAKYWKFEDEDSDFNKQWKITADMMKKDPRAKAIIFKALKDAAPFKRKLKYLQRNGMLFDTDDPDWKSEMDDDSYSFAWEDADLDANTALAKEARDELGPTDEDLADIEAGDDNPEKLLAELDEGSDKNESWGNLAKTLKDKHL